MVIDAKDKQFDELNKEIWLSNTEGKIVNCLGQRFIAAGLKDKSIEIEGIPGNALGAYLNGASIFVNGNAQDAVGDTMNEGTIVINGNVGDAAGYAMRGGEIYVAGNAGYRVGIHMKEYKEKKPVIVIGGRVGSFLGEYLAGGRIIVLGTNRDDKPLVGSFPCAGMHGGKIFLYGDVSAIIFPDQVHTKAASTTDWEEIEPYITRFCEFFGFDKSRFIPDNFTVVSPDGTNPYKQLYVAN